MATQQPAGGVETQQQAQIEYEKYGRIESHAPMWRTGTRFDLYAYLSTNNRSFEKREVSNNEHDTMIMPGAIKVFNKGPLIWEEKNIFFSTSKENTTRTISLNLTKGDIPQPWQNSSVWLHVYLCRKKSKPFYNLGSHDVAHTMIDLVAYMKRPKAKLVKNLISGDISESDKEILAKNAELNVTEDQEDEIIPMWKPEIYIDMVEEDTVFPPQGIPLPLLEHMKFNDKGDRYFPMVYMNEFWLTRSKMIPVNDTLDTLPIEIVFRVENKFKWLMLVQWESSMSHHKQMGTQNDKEQDEMKRIFLESNPYLLAVTGCVSILHTVFDMLAFKNDISFWRKVDSMQGLSVRSIFTSIVTQTIILLYLFDNDTSWLILFSSSIGLVIEVWKVKKAMDFQFIPGWPFLRLHYKQSYKSETLKYDQLAMRYLQYVLYPLCFGFSVFSLMYNHHKSWWSWLIGSAVGCVYTFGFIMMTPQLFINYKLKSVAHLPWRAMVYKFLNTIIDDLFAFVIKMPTLHKLSVFRDDLIFVIYLYQRWTYRVDKKRVNEYGLVAKDMEDEEGDANATQAAAAGGEPAAKKAQ